MPVGSKDAAEIRQQKQTANSIAAQANMAQNAAASAAMAKNAEADLTNKFGEVPTSGINTGVKPTGATPAGTSFAPKGYTVPGSVTPTAVNNTVAAKPADAGKPGAVTPASAAATPQKYGNRGIAGMGEGFRSKFLKMDI